jgi:hypothetical protein
MQWLIFVIHSKSKMEHNLVNIPIIKVDWLDALVSHYECMLLYWSLPEKCLKPGWQARSKITVIPKENL